MEKSEALVSVVKREIGIGNFLLEKYKAEERDFEKKHKMHTKDFLLKFNNGKLGDDEDFFEWLAISKAVTHWENKLKMLKEYQ